jgi:hypothetical protein
MPDETLLEMLKEVRWKTLKLLEGVDETQAHFAPPGLNNTILWNAGHALVVVEHLALVQTTGAASQLPPAWFDKFSWKSNPATVTQWPMVSEVVEQLKNQRDRLAAFIRTLSQEHLDRVVGEPPRSRTLRGMIVHGLHDEADHQGEIQLLKKLWKTRG